MKSKIKYSFITMLISFVMISILAGFIIEPDDTPVALIKKVVKDVTYRLDSDSDVWEDAKAGIPLKDGHEVKTGFKSLALVLFTDGSGVLRVRENSVLQIYGEKEENRFDKNTYIDKGEVGFEVTKQEDEEFKFTTPTVVASIRGTAGYVGVNDDSSTTIMCSHGMIELNALLGQRQSSSVSGGSTARIGTDGGINVSVSSGDEQKTFEASQQTETKKIRIRTNKGDLEIEYIPESE
ncbi:MAG: FecR family protein [Bacteroidetes bacterium]|nr:FecR family protein [Bacteroidota bacterium]